jgi:hypothetical protein
MLTKEEMDAFLEEALALAGGDMEIVARAALRELVELKIEKATQVGAATTIAKKRGRPSKAGLSQQYAKYKKANPRGAPSQTGLPISTKESGEAALRIQQYGVTVSDSPIDEVKPQSDKEAAERTIQVLDPGWFLEKSVKHEAKIVNVAKRMSEVRSRKP